MAARFWQLLKGTCLEWWKDNTFRMSAALAFYMTFSLAPLLVIAISVAGIFFDQESARRQVAAEIGTLAGNEAEEAVQDITTKAQFAAEGPWALIIGAATLLLGSTVVFAELQSALNQIWDVKVDAHKGGIWKIVRDRLLSFGLVLAVAFLLLVSLVINTGLSAAEKYLADHVAHSFWIWRIASLATSTLVIALLFALIYRFLPDARVGWRDVAVGAIVTAVLFGLGKFLIGLYLGRMTLGSTYGIAGSFGVFLIWVYYSALICFFGAEFTQVYARLFGSRIRPSSHAVRKGDKPNDLPQ